MAIQTVNPATGERLRTFESLSPSDLDAKLAGAANARHAWAGVPLAERVKIVGRAGELLDERKQHYGRLMTLEMGKTLRSAVEEAAKCAAGCKYYFEHAEAFLGDELVDVEGETGYVAFPPLGVVLAIMPWNFPFWQVIRFAAPALCAGNVGLLKHASNVPQCAVALEELFRDAGAPDGVFQTLLIGSDAIPRILDDERVAAVTLTGSERAGQDVAARAGRQLKKTVLELGGSDPFIVMPSADLERAATTAVKARMINNGQSCIAAKRFVVHEAVFEEFCELYVELTRSLVVGDPMDDGTEIGPLATEQIRDDLDAQVKETVRRGGRVLTGGKVRPGAGYYYEPTVLIDVSEDSPAYRDEVFGPVATLIRARDAGDAIRIANGTRFGLGASAWTTEGAEARRFTVELQAGSVFINAMVASDPRFPFGGVKASGYGRELSAFGLREFVNIKTVRIAENGKAGGALTE